VPLDNDGQAGANKVAAKDSIWKTSTPPFDIESKGHQLPSSGARGYSRLRYSLYGYIHTYPGLRRLSCLQSCEARDIFWTVPPSRYMERSLLLQRLRTSSRVRLSRRVTVCDAGVMQVQPQACRYSVREERGVHDRALTISVV
jgi:hypothetical protein